MKPRLKASLFVGTTLISIGLLVPMATPARLLVPGTEAWAAAVGAPTVPILRRFRRHVVAERLVSDRPLAVIDLGSNSARVVVFRAGPGGHLEILAEGRSPLRLARGMEERHLSEEAIGRTVLALRDFRAITSGSGAARTIAVATAAVREAANAEELLERVYRESGLEVRVIPGMDEARYAFVGAVQGLHCENGIIIDIGGGSLELSRFRDRELVGSWTFDLGALALSDRFLLTDPPRADEIAALTQHVRRSIAEGGAGVVHAGEQLVGTGGTIRNLAKIDRRANAYPIPLLHGYVLTRARVEGVAGLVASRKLSRRRSLAGLNADRADSIVGGALVASAVMEELEAPDLLVSGQGLREGIAYDALGIRPSHAPAIRQSSIAALAARFGTWDRARAERRVAIAARLQLAVDPVSRPGTLERLEHAANILDVGRSIDYYRRYEHTADVLVASDLAGFSHRRLALLAAVVRQAGDPDMKLRTYRPLVGPDDRVPIGRSAVTLAIADEIERRMRPNEPVPVEIVERKREFELGAPLFDPYRQGVLGARFRGAFGKRLVWRAT